MKILFNLKLRNKNALPFENKNLQETLFSPIISQFDKSSPEQSASLNNNLSYEHFISENINISSSN